LNVLELAILMMEFCECEHGELGYGHDDYCPCLAMSVEEMMAAKQTLDASQTVVKAENTLPARSGEVNRWVKA